MALLALLVGQELYKVGKALAGLSEQRVKRVHKALDHSRKEKGNTEKEVSLGY